MEFDLFDMLNSMNDSPVIRESTCTRAPMGYPGGKGESAKHILPLLPYRNTYVEPFGGSGTILLLRDAVPLEIFNDKFSGVCCFYRVLRDRIKLEQLLDRVEHCLHSREEFEWCRGTWESCEDEVERAARWWTMHQMSFGKQGRHFGRSTSGKAQTGWALRGIPQFFRPTHHRLQGVQIENLDWTHIMKDYDSEETVFYLDPPYVKYSKGQYKHEFTKKDHFYLCEFIFTRVKGFVALSGYSDPETRDIYDRYKWDDIVEWEVNSLTAGINVFPDAPERGRDVQRGMAKECLWIKEAE